MHFKVFCEVNCLLQFNSYPFSTIDDYIDGIGIAHFDSEFDLLKSYIQVPLTKTACELFAFFTLDGLFYFTIMQFNITKRTSNIKKIINDVMKDLNKFIFVSGSTSIRTVQQSIEPFY